MTIPEAQPHLAALAALLRAGAALAGVTGYVIDITDDPPAAPYWVLYPGPGVVNASKVCGDLTDLDLRWQITTVGRDADEALGVQDAVRLTILGQRLTVAGRSCGRIVQVPGQDIPVRADYASRTAQGRPLFYGVVLYATDSRPA